MRFDNKKHWIIIREKLKRACSNFLLKKKQKHVWYFCHAYRIVFLCFCVSAVTWTISCQLSSVVLANWSYLPWQHYAHTIFVHNSKKSIDIILHTLTHQYSCVVYFVAWCPALVASFLMLSPCSNRMIFLQCVYCDVCVFVFLQWPILVAVLISGFLFYFLGDVHTILHIDIVYMDLYDKTTVYIKVIP